MAESRRQIATLLTLLQFFFGLLAIRNVPGKRGPVFCLDVQRAAYDFPRRSTD